MLIDKSERKFVEERETEARQPAKTPPRRNGPPRRVMDDLAEPATPPPGKRTQGSVEVQPEGAWEPWMIALSISGSLMIFSTAFILRIAEKTPEMIAQEHPIGTYIGSIFVLLLGALMFIIDGKSGK